MELANIVRIALKKYPLFNKKKFHTVVDDDGVSWFYMGSLTEKRIEKIQEWVEDVYHYLKLLLLDIDKKMHLICDIKYTTETFKVEFNFEMRDFYGWIDKQNLGIIEFMSIAHKLKKRNVFL